MTRVYCDCYDCYNNDDDRCVLDSISLTFRMTGDGQRALCDDYQEINREDLDLQEGSEAND